MNTLTLSTPATTSAPMAAVVLIARVLLALMFVLAGISKFGNLQGTAGYIASGGLPLASLLAPLVAALEVLGGLALIVGFQARWAALALALFTLVATVLFHNYWAMPADKQFVQQLMFMKNLAVAGGLLFVFAMGAGPLSLDARRASK
jgi:putative oxidoreductase